MTDVEIIPPRAVQPYQEQPRWSMDQLVASWLAGFGSSEDTKNAYRGDLRQFLVWCSDRGLDPLAVGLPEVQVYGEHLRVTGYIKRGPRSTPETLSRATPRPYSARTVRRKIDALSSFYAHCARAGVLPYNPARDASRPRYDRHYSPTQALTEDQVRKVLGRCHRMRQRVMDPLCLRLSLQLMFDLGIRVSEVCKLDLANVGQHDGMRALTVHAKGSKIRVRPVTAQIGPMLDAWRVTRAQYADPAEPALFVTYAGRRITRWQVLSLFDRAAKESDIPVKITPHTSRHTFNKIAEERGVPLEVRQHALGHASSVTTQLYGHRDVDLSRDPAHIVSAITHTSTETQH